MLAYTRDISAAGAYILIDRPIQQGSTIEFDVTMPPEVTLTDNIHVRCIAEIVRVDLGGTDSPLGVGVRITHYEFVADEPPFC